MLSCFEVGKLSTLRTFGVIQLYSYTSISLKSWSGTIGTRHLGIFMFFYGYTKLVDVASSVPSPNGSDCWLNQAAKVWI